MSTIDRAVIVHREWLREADVMAKMKMNHIFEDCDYGGLDSLQNVADSLAHLATYYGIKGLVQSWDNAGAGDRLISKSIYYRYWSLRIRVKVYSNTAFLGSLKSMPNLTNQLSEAASLLAVFMPTDEKNIQSEIWHILKDMIDEKGVVDEQFLVKKTFEPFICWLYSEAEGLEINVEKFDLGIYQKVINSWNDESSDLSSELYDICEYHLLNNGHNSSDGEFSTSPFDLLDHELHAIYHVRIGRGLKTMIPKHELTSSPFNEFRYSNKEDDEHISRVRSFFEEF